jgi:hypothetical protein
MEEWNSGMMGSCRLFILPIIPSFHYSTFPAFHYSTIQHSNIPVFREVNVDEILQDQETYLLDDDLLGSSYHPPAVRRGSPGGPYL